MSKSKKPREVILKLKLSSRKFRAALDFLDDQGLNISDVVNIVNDELSRDGIRFTSQDFSKLSLLHKDSQYISGPSNGKLLKIHRILTPYILHNFNCEYSESEEIYTEISDDINNPRLTGIIGTYMGYSWHEAKEMVHVFKINIVSIREIICVTHNATFTSKKMALIGNDKVAIEMKSNLRHVSLILEIGTASIEHLKQAKTFKVAYVDSGDRKTKCGLGIIERTDRPFNELETISKPLSFFKDTKDKEFLDLIKGNQLVIK